MSDAQQRKAVAQIANTSTLLRDAIAASIPVSPEQYLTIAIPGEAIDTRLIEKGGTFVYGVENSAFVPPQVRQAEARLVDKMMPLANVMVGNTGKSVSRSYSRALDGLIPRKATVKSGINQIRSPGELSYDQSMRYLTTVDTITKKTPIDIYVEKQTAWAEAQNDWDRAKIQAQHDAEAKFPRDLVKQRTAYDDWNQANFRKFKFAVQGRWMDWVANGHKYDVEYNFGMVDTDSIMARVEHSKESMRNSTFVDADGANELQGVNLSPKNWATLCQKKSEGWFKRNGEYSLPQLDAEILRLENLKLSYNVMKGLTDKATPEYPLKAPEGEGSGTESSDQQSADDLKAQYEALYKAEADLAGESAKIRKGRQRNAAPDSNNAYLEKKKKLQDQRALLAKEVEKRRLAHAEWTKDATATLKDDMKSSVQDWINLKVRIIDTQIEGLNNKRKEKVRTMGMGLPVLSDATAAVEASPAAAPPASNSGASAADQGSSQPNTAVVAKPKAAGTITAAPGDELAAPLFGVNVPATSNRSTGEDLPEEGSTSDPWTTIKVSFSAEEQSSTENTSSWGMSVGGGAGWGLWSVGGSYAHDQTNKDSTSDMAKCDVSLSFSALVVNIDRPWLYAELFNDFELDVADNIRLSPGAGDLKRLMADQCGKGSNAGQGDVKAIAELAQYNSFPAFPTSFIVAADVVIEFSGDTSHVEDHFSAQSNSGSVSVGYGPFSVSSSFHQSSSQQSHQMQSTATGCRLTFAAPQIIGWVSQILPALPRKPGFEPMVQNMVTSSA